ncbi:MAG: HAD-IA family hydrolase [Elusimicrobiaceae bacterium]|nr:HAD-IA family hydrolase [Elusimicrobiaceae bacterium]
MLVVFDLDGTLLNTIADLTCAVNYALRVHQFPPRSQEQCLQFVGNGVAKLVERALPEGARSSSIITAVRDSFFTYYNAHLTDKTTIYPGMEETLFALQARHIKIAVASNKYQTATEKIIAHFFPQISFAAVLGQREGVAVKPDPTIVYDILLAAGEEKSQCLYVGDSDVDMQTSHNAGVRSCAVTWGFRSRKLLANCHPDYLIDCPEELLPIL